jgi:hypothetical protein
MAVGDRKCQGLRLPGTGIDQPLHGDRKQYALVVPLSLVDPKLSGTTWTTMITVHHPNTQEGKPTDEMNKTSQCTIQLSQE